jgi:hypothetical protein
VNTRPFVAGAGFKEATALSQYQAMKEVALLLSFDGDHDFHIPRMRKDRKVVLRLMKGSAVMRAAMTMATTRL